MLSTMMTVKECAKELGITEQALRIRIQKNIYPEFSRGVPPGEHSKIWDYDIFRNKFYEFIGKEKTSASNETTDV